MGYPHHKNLIFKGLQYFFINRKPEKYNTITPNSGRPKNENINAIKQGDTFPISKCYHGKNNICKEKLSMEIQETKERKMNKKQRKEERTYTLFTERPCAM